MACLLPRHCGHYMNGGGRAASSGTSSSGAAQVSVETFCGPGGVNSLMKVSVADLAADRPCRTVMNCHLIWPINALHLTSAKKATRWVAPCRARVVMSVEGG